MQGTLSESDCSILFGFCFVIHPIAVIAECREPVIVDKIWLNRNFFFKQKKIN